MRRPIEPPPANRVLASVLLLALAAACTRDAPPRVVQADLIALFPLTDAARERATIDLGTPEGDALVRGGFAPGETIDGASVALAVERKARVGFVLREPAPRRLRVHARRPAELASAGDRRLGTPVLVSLNGRRVGQIRVGTALATLEVELPAAAQRAGDNLLELDHPSLSRASRHDAGDGRPRNAVAYERIEIERTSGTDPPAAQLVAAARAGERALLLPPDAEVATFVRAGPSPELQLAFRRADAARPATLRVALRRDGESASAVSELTATADVSRASVPLDARDGDVVGIVLRVAGDGAVRVEHATIHGTAPPPNADASTRSSSVRNDALATSGTAAKPPNVLLYVIDTLRADHLGCYGYVHPTSPRIDAFARDGLLFTRALAQAPWTRPSVASILTGLEPHAHGASALRRTLAPDVATLAEILGERGYDTAAFVTNANVAGRLGFARGFETFADLPEDHARRELHVPSAELHVLVKEWLDRPRERPFFLWVHASDPHAPYTPDPAVLARFRTDGGDAPPPDVRTLRDERHVPAAGEPWVEDPSAFPADRLAALTAAYDAEIAQNDASFGALLDLLARRGDAARTLVVLTSDHGEELGDHGGLEHGHTLHEELLHVPLVIRLPDGRFAGERRTTLAQHVDVLPTVLDAIGASVPSGLHGRSLLVPDGAPAGAIEVQSHTELGPYELLGLATDAWKVVHPIVAPRGRQETVLYDRADLEERRDAARERPATVGYARQQLEAVHRAGVARRRDVPTIDAETAARLRALGYAD